MKGSIAFCLFEFSGRMASEFEAVGIPAVCVDLRLGIDILTWDETQYSEYIDDCYVIAHPPCTQYAVSGARWWADKDPALLQFANRLTRRTLEIIEYLQPIAYFIENPIGCIESCVPELKLLNKRTFDPYEYAGYAPDPNKDAYTKRTALWGDFIMPKKKPVYPHLGSLMHKLPPSPNREAIRSITPAGFAKAWIKANVGHSPMKAKQLSLFAYATA